MLNQKIRIELDYIPSQQDSGRDYLCFVVVANQANQQEGIQPIKIRRLYIPIKNHTNKHPSHLNEAMNIQPQTNAIPFNKRPKSKLNKDTIRWLQQLAVTTFKNLESHNFNAEFLAVKMNLSLRQLHRKLKQLTGLNPTQYLREARLQQARLLLENQTYTMIKMVCYKVGMRDVKYFSQQFKKRFGQLPSAFLE